jgi:hypothetical protein
LRGGSHRAVDAVTFGLRHTAGDAIGRKTSRNAHGTIFGTTRGANTRKRTEPVLAHRL